MSTNQEALNKYNSKWNNNNYQTASLYRKATNGKTARYGCRLQDHVLALLGADTKKLARIAPAGMRWVEWMTK